MRVFLRGLPPNNKIEFANPRKRVKQSHNAGARVPMPAWDHHVASLLVIAILYLFSIE